jgi:hypothetical protein
VVGGTARQPAEVNGILSGIMLAGGPQHPEDGLGLQGFEGLLDRGARVVAFPGELPLGVINGEVGAGVGEQGLEHGFLRARQRALEDETDKGTK